MNQEQWALLAAAAVLVFWMVGAYNRLVALRNAIGEAWAKVDEALRQRAAAAQPLLAALQQPLAAEHGALATLGNALAELHRCATVMGNKPVVEAHASAWVAAESQLAAASSRVFALVDLNAEARNQDTVAAQTARWRDAQQRLAFARTLFNESAMAYNEAITQFPTRLLLPLFGFGRAGRV
ncbi:MAG TPA: LemA family protein [Rubrivivax sp.]|jgi:LemA protein|nr:LemA family protein [Rubrivivax sp.]